MKDCLHFIITQLKQTNQQLNSKQYYNSSFYIYTFKLFFKKCLIQLQKYLSQRARIASLNGGTKPFLQDFDKINKILQTVIYLVDVDLIQQKQMGISLIRSVSLFLILFVLLSSQNVEAKAKNTNKKGKASSKLQNCDLKKGQCNHVPAKKINQEKPSTSYQPLEVEIDPLSYKSWTVIQDLDSHKVFKAWYQAILKLGFKDLLKLIFDWKMIWLLIKLSIIFFIIRFIIGIIFSVILIIAGLIGLGSILSRAQPRRNPDSAEFEAFFNQMNRR